MKSVARMKQAIERIKPHMWNEDSEPENTLEFHADFEIDDDGDAFGGRRRTSTTGRCVPGD